MKFGYMKNGKRVYLKIPKNNIRKPRTKRLRKKKFWLHCGDCTQWFTRYSQTHGNREDGKSICHSCLKKRIESARPELFPPQNSNKCEKRGEKIMEKEKCPILKENEWVVITEDGLWAMSEYSFKTKRDAIFEVSSAKLDSRNTPKVKRLSSGSYLYFPKDIDDGTFGETFTIKKVTKTNIAEIQSMLEEQWDYDPSIQYDS